MQMTSWLALATVCLLGAMTPGPSLAVVVKHSVGSSRLHGMAAAVAHGGGVLLYAAATVFGLALFLTSVPMLMRGLTLAGAAYLCWMGIQAWRSQGGMQLSPDAPPVPLAHAARDGALIAATNPKLMVFFVALFSQFLTPDLDATGKATLLATVAGIDTAWYLLMAFLVSRPGVLGWLRARMSIVNRLLGAVLVLLAVRVVLI